MDWLTAHWIEILVVIGLVISAGKVVSRWTKTDKDDKFWDRLAEFFSAIPKSRK
jgi:hypothetical protein